MIGALFAVAVLYAQAAPAADQGAATNASAPRGVSGVTVTGEQAKKRVADPKEVICHKEPVLGSLFPKQVCARREEFAQRTREDQKETRDAVLYNPLIVDTGK